MTFHNSYQVTCETQLSWAAVLGLLESERYPEEVNFMFLFIKSELIYPTLGKFVEIVVQLQ